MYLRRESVSASDQVRSTYPPKLVRLLMMTAGTTGCDAKYLSYTSAAPKPTRPMTSGAITCGEDQGYWMPAQVSAMMHDVALPMMIAFPLSSERESAVETQKTETETYIQSMARNAFE